MNAPSPGERSRALAEASLQRARLKVAPTVQAPRAEGLRWGSVVLRLPRPPRLPADLAPVAVSLDDEEPVTERFARTRRRP